MSTAGPAASVPLRMPRASRRLLAWMGFLVTCLIIGHTIHKATPVLAVAGMLISLAHQSSLGATYGILKARPIWFKPSMPILFILSAIAVGPAITMTAAIVLQWVTGRRTVPLDGRV